MKEEPAKDSSECEELAEKLHEWYLEATRELNPENYNPNAQKNYQELNEEQKNIDRYIARKIMEVSQESKRQAVEEAIEYVENEGFPSIGLRDFLALITDKKL
jgi:outer membrane protein assembly factor BamD (BamD/ComL family)